MKFSNVLPATADTCEAVQVLEIPHNPKHGVTDDDLARILPLCPNLKAVDFTGVPDLSDRTLVLLAQTTTELKSVDISGCTLITDVGVRELAAQANRLEVLKLSGVAGITDPSISAIVRSLSRLTELDIADLPLLTSHSVRDIWTFGKKLRKIKLARCHHVNDKGFPHPFEPIPPPEKVSTTADNSPVIPLELVRGSGELRKTTTKALSDGSVHRRSVHVMADPSKGKRASTWLDTLPPLILPAYHMLENLHSLDLTHCRLLTDTAVAGIVAHAPRLQHVHLSGCSLLTNEAVEHLCALAGHLETITLAHAGGLTDRAILELTRACPKLSGVDVSFCSLLTDLSVLELSILPNLHRLSIAGLPLVTDISLLFLAEHGVLIGHLHISHCKNIGLRTIHVLLRRLKQLEHFGASGIDCMTRMGIRRFSEKPAPNYNTRAHGPYRVFKGENIKLLCNFLDKEEMRRREAEKRNIPFIPRRDDSVDLY